MFYDIKDSRPQTQVKMASQDAVVFEAPTQDETMNEGGGATDNQSVGSFSQGSTRSTRSTSRAASTSQRRNLATETRNQRAWIDPSIKYPSFKVQSLLAVAENHIKTHCASLQEGLATILEEKGKNFISVYHCYTQKHRTLRRIESDTSFIPVSARVNFKLPTWDGAEDDDGYVTLQQEMETTVTNFQQSLRGYII